MVPRLIIIISLFLFPAAGSAQQLTVQILGDVFFNEDFSTITEAGENYPSTFEAQSSVQISVLYGDQLNSKNNPNSKWRIFIHKQDVEWNDQLLLEIRRTGTGSRLNNPGTPNIQNGENFQPITNTSGYFFQGMGEVVQIPLALKASGFSLTMGARRFETALVLTVYDEW